MVLKRLGYVDYVLEIPDADSDFPASKREDRKVNVSAGNRSGMGTKAADDGSLRRSVLKIYQNMLVYLT